MIGDLRHRVTIQKPVLTPSGGGGFAKTWQDVAEVYASVTPVSGGEALRFHQMETSVTHRITIRHRSDVTPAMRVVRGATAYDISVVVDRNGRGEYLDMLAAVTVPA